MSKNKDLEESLHNAKAFSVFWVISAVYTPLIKWILQKNLVSL
jgi:hypothetical protein